MDAVGLENVTVEYINYESQVARIRLSDNSVIGVNLWEIKDHTRQVDGFHAWRYSA